jgi:two-component system chemotaxis response regulator CheY
MTAVSRVLIVDDSTMSMRQLEQVLGSVGGYQVVGHARNGAEAIRLFCDLSPDIVCMDIIMPLVDGIAALRSILQLDAAARVIMVSSVGGARDRAVEALRLGARTVIAKPYDETTVRNALGSL